MEPTKKKRVGKMRVDNEKAGVYAVATTANPANEVRLIAMNKSAIKSEPRRIIFSDEAKKIITCALFIPGQLIDKKDTNGEEIQVTIDADQIELAAKKFHRFGFQNSTNSEHKTPLEGLTMYESWIIAGEKDKAYQLGYSGDELVPGTWMCTYDVSQNEEVWTKVMNGEIYGLSIEGLFTIEFEDEDGSLPAAKSNDDIMMHVEKLEAMVNDVSISDLEVYDAIKEFVERKI